MEKVSWKDKLTNEDVLNSAGEERSFVGIVLKRKKNWIGHIVRGDGLLKLVIERRMEGRKPRGRPRMGMLDELTQRWRRAEMTEEWRVWLPRTCLKVENL